LEAGLSTVQNTSWDENLEVNCTVSSKEVKFLTAVIESEKKTFMAFKLMGVLIFVSSSISLGFRVATVRESRFFSTS
jgi:hypothetical protein